MNVQEAQKLCQEYPPAERDAVTGAITRVALAFTNTGGVPPAIVSIILLALAIDIWEQAHGTEDLQDVFEAFTEHSLTTYTDDEDEGLLGDDD
jgi:hypothetical protein